MKTADRNNVTIIGSQNAAPMIFAHGYGCDQQMWRHVWPHFEADHKIVLFDYVGNGASITDDVDRERYTSLNGYAADLIEIIEELDLRNITFVGHSVSATIGILAAAKIPDRFANLVLVGPSPRYINDESTGYHGGFERSDIDDLLVSLEKNFPAWSRTMAPVIMGHTERPELGDELVEAFCRSDPDLARKFAHATFLSDNREDLKNVTVPTLILQSRDDIIAPVSVGEYVHKTIAGSELVILDTTGHCPHLSMPDETSRAIRSFLTASAGHV